VKPDALTPLQQLAGLPSSPAWVMQHFPPSVAPPPQHAAGVPMSIMPVAMQPHGPFAYSSVFAQQFAIGPCGEAVGRTHPHTPPSAVPEQQLAVLPWALIPAPMQPHGPFAYWRLFEQQLPIGPPGSSPGRTQPQSPPSAVAEQQLDLLPSSLIPAPMQPHGPFAYSKLFEQQSLVICPTPTESW
jgi:hypothetical protein